MVIYYGIRGMEVWMDQTHENDKNIQIHNFCKIKWIRKIFSEYSRLRTILHFCFLEYRAITLSCYHMGPWYTTHMVPEWYYTKMGINRLEIDWRVIFESISINFSKWLHYTIIVLAITTCRKWPKIGCFKMIIKSDRLIRFSSGFLHDNQFRNHFRMIYNINRFPEIFRFQPVPVRSYQVRYPKFL